MDYVKSKFPYWNQTVAAKQARHIMVTLFDSGPGEAFAEGNQGTNPNKIKIFPPDMDPSSSERNIIFLMWNGRRDVYPKEDRKDYRCGVCFHVGLDIMIPTMEVSYKARKPPILQVITYQSPLTYLAERLRPSVQWNINP